MLLFYMRHFDMGLTDCYKAAVFVTFIFAVFLLNLTYSFRQTLPAIVICGIEAARCFVSV